MNVILRIQLELDVAAQCVDLFNSDCSAVIGCKTVQGSCTGKRSDMTKLESAACCAAFLSCCRSRSLCLFAAAG